MAKGPRTGKGVETDILAHQSGGVALGGLPDTHHTSPSGPYQCDRQRQQPPHPQHHHQAVSAARRVCSRLGVPALCNGVVYPHFAMWLDGVPWLFPPNRGRLGPMALPRPSTR